MFISLAERHERSIRINNEMRGDVDVVSGLYLSNEAVEVADGHILTDGASNAKVCLVIQIPLGLGLFGFEFKELPVEPVVCFVVLPEIVIDRCYEQIWVAMLITEFQSRL